TADLDDARDAGILTWEQCREELPCFGNLARRVEQQFAGATFREQFVETLRALLDAQATGLIEGTRATALASGAQIADDLRFLPARVATYSPESTEANRQLKAFLREKVYNSSQVRSEREHCESQVAALFAYLVENPEAISVNFREYHEQESPQRLVCDYIAGMTDGYFRMACQRYLC
ncbi:MAG: deoxyguanosinetriphosphate triphosphohydrolase, partial [Bryobacterales bacterium]|nr:deoxyguanosinetriphosphate triphosphohydrolase [Bryobacterales bacterium]